MKKILRPKLIGWFNCKECGEPIVGKLVGDTILMQTIGLCWDCMKENLLNGHVGISLECPHSDCVQERKSMLQ